jgi:hypothetical protein
MASVAPGLGLGAPSKIPIDFKIFQWKCPFQNENGLALSKMKFQACNFMLVFALLLLKDNYKGFVFILFIGL